MAEQIAVKVITGSTREGRFSHKAAEWIAAELSKQDGVTAEIVDLKDYEMPFFNEPVSPSMKSEPYKNENVARFTAKVAEGDAFVVVSPEYNHSIPGVLKNALDWVYQEWNQKAIGFVSYGTAGGARAVEHLRGIAIELQMAPVRQAIHIPGDQYFPVTFGQGTPEELFAKMQKQADAFVPQLLWWARALKTARAAK